MGAAALAPPWLAELVLTCGNVAAAPAVDAVDKAWVATDVSAETEGSCGPNASTLAPPPNACAEASRAGVARTTIGPETPAPMASAKAKVVVEVVDDWVWLRVWAA
jgi:hypothetical protein